MKIECVVIDDEVPILRGIIKLIDWNELGYAIPAIFSQPDEAFQYICAHHPQVVITDICMPKMTGNELIDEVMRYNAQTKIIAISSYSEFEYIKKALVAGVKNYILKPIDERELASTLTRVRRELESGDASAYVQPIVQKVLFEKLVAGMHYALTPTEKQLFRHYESQYVYQVLYAAPATDASEEDWLRPLLAASGAFSEYYYVPDGANAVVVLIRAEPADASGQDAYELLQSACPIVVARPSADFSAIHTLVREMKRALETRVFYGATAQTGADASLAPDAFVASVSDAVAHLDWDQIHQSYAAFVRSIRLCRPALEPDAARTLLEDATARVVDWLVDVLGLADACEGIDVPATACARTLEEACALQVRRLFDAIERCKTALFPAGERTVSTVELYIRLNSHRPLTLKSVARKFYFNPSYLSYLFSKDGKRFLRILNNIRLEKAAGLLISSDDTISCIALKTGFQHEKTFYTAFRQKYGCTPTQYRNNAD